MYQDKLKELEKDIESLKNNDTKRLPVSKGGKELKMAANCFLELISGIIAGGFIGYILDKLFTTHMVFFAVFMILGVFAGILNLNRCLKGY